MATIKVRDIDWQKYGIENPADLGGPEHVDNAVANHGCHLEVNEQRGEAWLKFQWRLGIRITLDQAQRLIDEAFTHPFYREHVAYATQFGHERIYMLPELEQVTSA